MSSTNQGATAPTLDEALSKSVAETASKPLSDEAKLIIALEERGDDLSMQAAASIDLLVACGHLLEWLEKSATKRVETLEAQNAALKEALRFYADPSIYKPHPHGPAFDRRDLSFRARTAIKEAGADE